MRISAPNRASVQKGENWVVGPGAVVLRTFSLAPFDIALFGLSRNFVLEMLVRRVMASNQADAATHNYSALLLLVQERSRSPSLDSDGQGKVAGSMFLARAGFSRPSLCQPGLQLRDA